MQRFATSASNIDQSAVGSGLEIDGTRSAFSLCEEVIPVLYYALVFLIVGLIAGVLGATGVASIASQIAWILFIIGVILLVIHLATGRRGPVV